MPNEVTEVQEQQPAVETPETVQPEKGDVKATETEEQSAGSEKTTDEQNQEQERPPQKGGFQRRIDKLTKRVSMTEAERDHWRDQALRGQPPTDKKTEQVSAPKAKPKVDDFRIEGTDQFDIAAFTEAMTDYKAEQKIAEIETKRQEAEQRRQFETQQSEIAKKYDERCETARKNIPDFDEKAEECFEMLREIAPDPSTAPEGARVIGDVLLRRDPSGKLEYYFGSNPNELERIAHMETADAQFAIAELRVKLATSSTKTEQEEADEEEEAPAPVVTKAPPPLTPARKSSPAARPFDPSDPRNDKDMTFEEWNKRDTERRRKR